MKAALFLLSLCLLITFSRKRAVNPYQFIADKSNIQIRIAEDDRSDAHGIGRGSVLLKRIFMLALTDDDGFRSLRSRQILSGLPGCFHAITVNMYSRVNTEDYFNEIYTDLPSHLFNKGSPENESIRITYFITNFKSSDCLFRLLHQYYTFPLSVNKDVSPLCILRRYLAITHIQPPIFLETIALYIGQHCFSGIFVVKANGLSLIERLYFPLDKSHCISNHAYLRSMIGILIHFNNPVWVFIWQDEIPPSVGVLTKRCVIGESTDYRNAI